MSRRIADFGALPAPGGLGLLLAGPTIITHGSDAQRARYLRPIVTGADAWCQLFSEPGAGSDLASVQTRADRDGDEWIVNGQKVWSSGAHFSDRAMLIARTNRDVPKHQGITWFAFDMDQPGVEVRPLREMTGRSLFNEVFLTDARVSIDDVLGRTDEGWAVTNTTLMLERTGLGGGHGASTRARPGRRSGHLDRRAGDFVVDRRDGRGDPIENLDRGVGAVMELAVDRGRSRDQWTRQQLVSLHILDQLIRLNSQRLKQLVVAGLGTRGLANIMKLQMSQLVSRSRDVGMSVAGAYGTLHAYSREDRAELDEHLGIPGLGLITENALFASAPSIYGGTDQIQRNILGERVLSLPKEPSDAATTPFRDLPHN